MAAPDWFYAAAYLLPLLLIVAAFFTGSIIESRHYRSIEQREREFLGCPLVTFDDADGQFDAVSDVRSGHMVSGSVVISVDRFKQFVAGLRNLFGGRVSTYETLLDRGRREAMLRMQAAAGGADLILNVRIQTATLGGNGDAGLGTVEVHAYGTALYRHAAAGQATALHAPQA